MRPRRAPGIIGRAVDLAVAGLLHHLADAGQARRQIAACPQRAALQRFEAQGLFELARLLAQSGDAQQLQRVDLARTFTNAFALKSKARFRA